MAEEDTKSPSWGDICEEEKTAQIAAAPLDAPVTITSIEITNAVPETDEICQILGKCGMIKHTHKPPEEYAQGDYFQRAIHEAYTINPLGINCAGGHTKENVCFRQLTRCNYAKIIAVIYQILKATPGLNSLDGMDLMTEANISRIDIKKFMLVYAELFATFRTQWFGVYPLYLNAKLHIELYNHACSPKCPIISAPYQGNDAALKQLIIEHKVAYYHDQNFVAKPMYSRQYDQRRAYRDPRAQYEETYRDPRAQQHEETYERAPQRAQREETYERVPQRRERAPAPRARQQHRPRDDGCHEIDIASAMSKGQAMHKELSKSNPKSSS